MRRFIRAARSLVSVTLWLVVGLLVLAPRTDAKPTQVLAFGMRANSNFELRKNNGPPLMVRSSSLGGIFAQVDAIVGDRLSIGNAVTVDVSPTLPQIALAQNVPNPFNPATRITYSLAETSHARVSVYDVRGAFIATLVDDDVTAGNHTVEWSGVDSSGRQVASGVYFYTLEAGDRTMSKKMMLLK